LYGKEGEYVMKKIVFSGHAEMKFDVLERHGFVIERALVISAIRSPEIVEEGYKGRKIAQKTIDELHVIRVVYQDFPEELRVITFYPGRRKRYEN